MPALTMRGRYLMREYWSDTDLFTRLSADTRELYMGLWMLADDSGWMPRDVVGRGAALYRFEAPEAREATVRAGLARLRGLGKLTSLRCGCIFVPSVAKYPRAGHKSTEHALNHQSHSNGFEAPTPKNFKDIQKGSKPSPVPSLPDLTRPSAGARDGFKERMAANGGKVP
jgi:hypothetical protein